MEIIIRILGTVLFFLPGAALVWLIFRKINLSAFIAYAIIFSIFSSTLSVFALYHLGFLSFNAILGTNIVLGLGGLLLVLFLKDRCRVVFDKYSFFMLTALAVFGTFWRHFFKSQIFKWGDGITSHIETVLIEKVFYSGGPVPIPDAGFYTGMIAGRAEIMSGQLSNFYYSLIAFSGYFATFLVVYLLSFFTYKVILLYKKDSTLSWLGAFIVGSLGAGEIWMTTIGLTEVVLAYPAFISLFILLKERSREFFLVTLALAISVSLSYYTGILVLFFSSLGFIMAFGLRSVLEKTGFPKYGFRYAFLFFICLFSLFVLTGETLIENTFIVFGGMLDKIAPNLDVFFLERTDRFGEREIGPTVNPKSLYQYRYRFLDVSLLSWQNLFLLALALTFLIGAYLKTKTKDNLLKEYRDILVMMIPAVIVGFLFVSINMGQRSFVYLAFLPFLICHLPGEKILRYFMIFALIVFFIVTGYFHNSERIIIQGFTETEVGGAKWASQNIEGLVLSDQRFLTLLMENDYYQVDGFIDHSSFNEIFFYQEDIGKIKEAFSVFDAEYFITTERMRNSHILMAGFHQFPMKNNAVYEANFQKIYDNEDVRIYKIEQDEELFKNK